MRFFLHTSTRIRIINNSLEWQGTPAQFQALEPAYSGLPSGAVVRYQTDDLKYTENAAGVRSDDAVDCLQYCNGAYLTTPGPALTLSGLDARLQALEAAGSGAGVPIGSEMAWPFATAPSGWIFAQGGTVLRSSEYGAILVAAGCPYGVGDGSTTVHIPDRRGRFLLGASAAYTLYSTGGEATHTLTIPEMPSHGGHTAGQGIWGMEANTMFWTAYGVNNVGGGQAHNNLPPYQAVNFIIYIGA